MPGYGETRYGIGPYGVGELLTDPTVSGAITSGLLDTAHGFRCELKPVHDYTIKPSGTLRFKVVCRSLNKGTLLENIQLNIENVQNNIAGSGVIATTRTDGSTELIYELTDVFQGNSARFVAFGSGLSTSDVITPSGFWTNIIIRPVGD